MEHEPEPEPKKLTAIEFAKHKLGINPEATFAEIKAQAHVEGIPIYPVVYGRAKALLGLVPTAPYGSKSKVRKAAAAAEKQAAEARDRARAREVEVKVVTPRQDLTSPPEPATARSNGDAEASPRTVRARAAGAKAATDSFASLEGMITDLKNAVRERDSYRLTLEKIADLIKSELAG